MKDNSKHMQRVIQWNKAARKNGLGTTFELDETSLVVDLGAFKGLWAKKIVDKYHCKIYAFEPVNKFINTLKSNIGKKGRVFRYAVGNSNRTDAMYVSGDGSSLINIVGPTINVKVRCITEVFNELNINTIDLLKINVEGLEYEILEKIIEGKWLPRIKNLHIQFHREPPQHVERRNRIRKELFLTHKELYCYKFVWEGWRRK